MPRLNCSTCSVEFDSEASTAMPFCSPRCQQADLGRWLNEAYGIPYVSEDEYEAELPLSEGE